MMSETNAHIWPDRSTTEEGSEQRAEPRPETNRGRMLLYTGVDQLKSESRYVSPMFSAELEWDPR